MTSYTPEEHRVKHISKIPANEDIEVELPVREYNGTHGHDRQPVLMLHGRSVPALPGFDLAPVPGENPTRYSWAQELAKAGFDVFIMDLQGSGRSPRPMMDVPCNANPAQQAPVLVPNPLPQPCTPPPPYPFQLGNSESEWAEVKTVVDYIRDRPGADKPIHFVGWSAAAFVMGPYALQYPGDVKSLFLLAPMFPPKGRWSEKPDQPFGRPAEAVDSLPLPGFPMHVSSRTGFKAALTGPTALWEPGIAELAWEACMQNDHEGSKWGPTVNGGEPEGVLRYRNTYWWGWNNHTVPLVRENKYVLGGRVPVLILYGENDRTANTTTPMPDNLNFSVPALYKAIAGSKKLMFCSAESGHSLVWETTAEAIHHFSKHWLKNGKVEGFGSGSYFRELDGNLIPLP
ncbi:alpha/beta hydrolase [Streptomyces caniscabiei]|uniref:alpha/beta hydrolase n=1 Tax=Streptomyces caniscabiei TaxID=2746961 RepID=UPI0018725469|nr:alpha/beta fold hydrolase [Streptomyces caniscabiei]MBE4768777.1 alpha/beta fold hydrolase [Streptomyces caniscabiei]MDX2951223.1 alpha/beta fold hydrolase [Streptomyces caniscabiei]